MSTNRGLGALADVLVNSGVCEDGSTLLTGEVTGGGTIEFVVGTAAVAFPYVAHISAS